MNHIVFLSITFIILTTTCKSQNLSSSQAVGHSEKYASKRIDTTGCQNVRIVFYNVENLYDPYDDSLKIDEEFTKSGAKRWSYARFREKLSRVAKTLIAIGEREPPALVGLCEIENKYVLNKLILDSPLKRFGYRFIHHDSPDLRGVDVALLYLPQRFSPLLSKTFIVKFPFDTTLQTRELLLVKGVLFQNDTLNVIINHWPSRRGGYEESQPRRNFVAGLVKKICDSLFNNQTTSKIILMGDFNDEPDKESLLRFLLTDQDTTKLTAKSLVNLMFPMMKKWDQGTIKYQGQWSIFDQFIVSGNLLMGNAGIKTSFSSAHIFKGSFLTMDDGKNFGEKLYRTYTGPRYTGGFSDHLPIYLDLREVLRKNEP